MKLRESGQLKGLGGSASNMNDDVHQLRGIKLKGLKRDPSYFLGGVKVEKAHLEKCFDADTLFYDIFFEPTNRYLVAVGPSLGNLRMALQLYVNGNLIELSENIRHHRQFLVMGKVRRVEKLNDILIKANGQQWQLSVPENNSGTGHKFTLCALQKDNPRGIISKLEKMRLSLKVKLPKKLVSKWLPKTKMFFITIRE